MRKYYLFIIKREYFNLYYNKPYSLYKMLQSLKNLKAYDFSYGIKIFKEICLPFSVKLLNNYFNKKINLKRINDKKIKIASKFEETFLELNYSCIVVKTNINMPEIMRILNIYNKNMLVCDFENNDYFWLNDYFKATLKK